MSSLTEMVPVSSIPKLNAHLSSATLNTMVELMGAPSEPLVNNLCRNDQASPAVKRLLETRRMTPQFRLSGIKPALDSVEKVLAKVKEAHPELIAQLSTEGMICVRHRNPAHGPPSNIASNHSWGTAVDFKLLGGQAPKATGDVVPRWVAMLVPFFNEAGWFSGIGFDDAMHFEVADETIRQWARDGKLGPSPPAEETVVAGGGSGSSTGTGSSSSGSGTGTGNGSSSGSGSILSGIGNFFSGLFGRG